MNRRRVKKSKKGIIIGVFITIGLVAIGIYSGFLRIDINASSLSKDLPKNYQIVEGQLKDTLTDRSIVLFVSSWCGPCGQLSNQFKQEASKNPGFNFYEIDIEDNRDLANTYQVNLTPSLLTYPIQRPTVQQEINSDDLVKSIDKVTQG